MHPVCVHCGRQNASVCAGSVVLAKHSACGVHVTSFQSTRECDVYTLKYLHVNGVLSSGTNKVPEVC